MNVNSANYRRTRLKPSSSARLERWALALRGAQIERKGKHVLDDAGLQTHIKRRFESEWLRDGAPADVLIAIRTTLGVESVEYCLSRVELRAFLMNEEARAWRNTLISAWEQDYVSLSAVVWWIASSGAPRDCDDDDLESAAKTLLRQVRSKEATLTAWGRQRSNLSKEEIPRNVLADAMPFLGMDEHKFFSSAPCVHWNSTLDNERTDVIEDKSGARTWCDISIELEDMLRLWPKMQVKATLPTEGPVTIGADSAEDPLAPYKTGAQGRPSPIQLIEREAERRRASGEALEKLTDEARYLSDWCARQHPNAPTPTSKTIENRIRPDHRNWKATK